MRVGAEQPVIEVACCANEAYMPHLGVMLHSLLSHTSRRPLRIWLMAQEAPPAGSFAKLESIVSGQRGELRLLGVPDKLLNGFPKPQHFHPMIWFRVLLADLLPQVDRILYLDADIVIADDVSPLWETHINDRLFAAVTAPFYPSQPLERPVELGLPSVDHYVSSGVMLMNLDLMRQEQCADKLRTYAQAHPNHPCPEQDALNALFHRRCLRLHPRWNAQPILFDTSAKHLPFTASEVREATSSPAIVHFSGAAKPWHYLSKHPLRQIYFDHLRQTPWPIKPLQGRTLRNRILRIFPVPWQYALLRKLQVLNQKVDRLCLALGLAGRNITK